MVNSYKKFLISTLISLVGLLTTQIAAAGNLYIGGEAGYLRTIFSTDLYYTDSGKSNQLVDEDKGVDGTFFIGYGQKIHRFYLGAEVEGSLYNAAHVTHLRTSIVRKKIRGAYGASIMPGYYITNHTLLFGNIGLLRGNFMFSKDSDKINRWLNGYYLGIGMSTQIIKRLHLVLEYQHNQYQRTTMYFGNERRRVTPDTGTISIGLIYDLKKLG